MPSINFTITAEDKNLQKVLRDIENGVNGTAQKVEKSGMSIESMFDRISKAAAGFGVALGAKELVSQVMRIRGEFQQLEVAFNTMLGSREKSARLMSQLTETAAITPFGLQDVAGGAKQLLAYGVAADDVNDTLIRLGDIAAGLSIPLNDLVYLYGTTMTQGRMFTQDLRQFMGRGIPLAEELAKQFGVTKDKVADLVTSGKVGFEEMRKAIVSMTSEGGKFGGLMEAQSKTIVGQISNLQDSIDVMFNEIGKSSEGVINTALSGVSTLVENYENVGKIVLSLVSAYGSYRAGLIVAAAASKAQSIATVGLTNAEKLHYYWLVMTDKAQKMLNKSMLANPYVLATVAVTGFVAGFVKLLNSSSGAETAFGRINSQLEDLNANQEKITNKVNEYIAIIQDENATEFKKAEAYANLNALLPQLTGKYSQAEIAMMGQANAAKALNKELENQNILLTKQQIRETESTIAKLKTERESFRIQGNKKAYELRTAQIKEEEAVLATLRAKEAEYRSAQQKEQEKSKVKNKEYWATLKKDAEMALSELDSSKKGSSEWIKLEKQIKQAESELDKYNLKSSAIKDANTLESKQREREQKIDEYKRVVIDAETQAQFEIRQAEINSMVDSTDKVIAQIHLDYDRRIAENEKRKQEFIKSLADQKALEWEVANPDKVKKGEKFDKSTVTEEDLTPQQNSILKFYDEIAKKEKETGTLNANKQLLEQYQTYAQKRLEIEEKFARDRYDMINEDGSYKEGFSKENENELNRQRTDALAEVDLEFAMREQQFESWANQVANLSITKLQELLLQAKQELGQMERDNKMAEEMGVKPKYSSEQMMKARATVAVLENANKDVQLAPGKRSTKEWQDLYKTLREVEGQFKEIGDAVGGAAGEIISTEGEISGSALSMINGIITLRDMAMTSTEQTAQTTSQAIQQVERASVILAIIGTAIKIITKIVNLASQIHDAKHEKRIQAMQKQVDALEKNYEKLGDAIERAYSTDASKLIEQQNQLLKQQKTLIQQQIKEEEEKKKTNKEQIESWKERIEDINKTLEENKDKAIDAIFGEDLQSAISDFAEAYADAVSSGEDRWVSVKDTVKEMMKQMVVESIKGALQSSKAIENIRLKLKEFYTDNILSQAEQDAIYKMAAEVQKNIDSQFGWAEDLLKDDTKTEQNASYGGFESMSEDTGSELNGRFTALQIAGEEIRVQMILAVNALYSLSTISSDGNSILSDILIQHAITNAYLEDIVKYSKIMSRYGEKLDKIVDQTKNL